MKKKTLKLYKELFCGGLAIHDELAEEHAREFREKYPDCPKPEKEEAIEIEVPYSIANDWVDKNGVGTDVLRKKVDDEIANLIFDRNILEYIDKNVKEPHLRANLSSCVSPLRKIRDVIFHTEDAFWHTIEHIEEIDTNTLRGFDYWMDEWKEDTDDNNIYVYFYWDDDYFTI